VMLCCNWLEPIDVHSRPFYTVLDKGDGPFPARASA
jgi:hypothetical protein